MRILLPISLLSLPAIARAQAVQSAAAAEPSAELAFVEGTFAYGFQLGETDYLPDASATDFEHPMVLGYAAGATAGYLITPALAVLANWEYASAKSRVGSIPDVLASVQGEIQYQTLVLGARLYSPLGPGRLRAEMAAGVVFPFETRLELEYGPALAAAGISGRGRRVDEFGLGVGVQAQLGYEIPISGPVYLGVALKAKAFQSNNNDEQTRLRNFVADFAAQPPIALNASIDNGDGGARPTTYSVQDIRLQLALGVRL